MDLFEARPDDFVDETLVNPGTGDISKFFHGTTIFITGATGFMGKMLIEKMLRSCGEVSRIYILVRVRNHYNIERRLADIFDVVIFDLLKSLRPDVLQKVQIIRGDMNLPNLGIELGDLEVLKAEVDVVFNLGATLPSDENFRSSVYVNVRSVRDLVALAKQMRSLKAFVHVSSVYANCPTNIVEEEFMKPIVSAKSLISFTDSMDPNFRHTKPLALGRWPNNYLFTKCVGEDAIKSEAAALPICIVRPALVVSSSREPYRGWSENGNGATGMVMTAYLGLARSIMAKKESVADLVPADHVINAILAAAWDVAVTRTLNDNQEIVRSDEEVPIYNLPAFGPNNLTWGQFFASSMKYCKLIPSIHTIRNPGYVVHNSSTLHFYITLFLHYIPAYLYDIFSLYFTSDAKYVAYYSKVDVLSDAISFNTLHSWDIRSSNTRRLWSKMSQADRRCFDFDTSSVDWEDYLKWFIQGIRMYILKDPMDTLWKAKKDVFKRKLMKTFFTVLFLVGVYWLVM